MIRYSICLYLTYFTKQVYRCCGKWQDSILFSRPSNIPLPACVRVYISPLLYPFICQWTFRLLPCLSYCKLFCIGKESACNAEDLGSIPGSRRSPGKGNGYPLQYSCLKNSIFRRAWQVTVHGGGKEWHMTE